VAGELVLELDDAFQLRVDDALEVFVLLDNGAAVVRRSRPKIVMRWFSSRETGAGCGSARL